ncbi:ATP-binding cassette domain-containing protein [Oceanimonas baumannii]|uniref:Amino acid ABC transporter ATP-binding protein (PAAT family) n=1 Tax=Oceanimonas baumannii TaxID=129578 RepID=A0A235CFZ5_9GAMM|nr:ATP-binding cassette domain-containing protein [Oceanimonas baumannii]OYD23289.1 histidine/lysine/arginine/ornithine ABC transporter ATP-binding protein [Oceanimonas baumannii]TDW58567.1 amino acid ABC transporter ATP-binding protein (PAAT family) [Oceanimonas baumannii]
MKPLALELLQIRKSFGDSDILKGVDLQAHEGEVISIIGSSGSGKSTLLRCANLLERPSGGEIRLFGEHLQLQPESDGQLNAADHTQLRRLRLRLGFVFQSFNLWPHMTVLENIMEAPVHVRGQSREEAEEQAMALLRRVGLENREQHYPAQLSGGQQQRVAIARALAMSPDILLFDEPTSALDPELVSEVLNVIRDLAEEGRTMLIVTHEMRFARDVSSQVMFLHQGRVEEKGPPRQLFEQPRSQRCREFLQSCY